jgi:hypothetical protein
MTEGVERHYQSALAAKLKEFGTSQAVDRLPSPVTDGREKRERKRTHSNSNLYDLITSDPAILRYLDKLRDTKGRISK